MPVLCAKSAPETRTVIACDKREAFAQGSEATKQSIAPPSGGMDCFAEPVIGRAFARPVGSQ
jgi:hypothetical protein